MGSSPTTGTTSEQSSLCSDVFLCPWQKKKSSARSLAPPFQIEPAPLGCGLIFTALSEIFNNFCFNMWYHLQKLKFIQGEGK
ncbi:MULTISPECIES: hypothetical protein [unclassified Flavonifractor]|uniref:hypothetical protein n=1 Tax=unclassified Flavonifractor TaxID=2629267 RepID=UPI00117A84DB|nr:MULTISPECIES: hypothetical protein [unclassified Flavonifractor]